MELVSVFVGPRGVVFMLLLLLAFPVLPLRVRVRVGGAAAANASIPSSTPNIRLDIHTRHKHIRGELAPRLNLRRRDQPSLR